MTRERLQDARAARGRAADEVSPMVIRVLDDLNRAGLSGGGQIVPRDPGELTWTLQLQLVSLRVTLSVDPDCSHFAVGYVGMPGSGSLATTSNLDEKELRETVWRTMRGVVSADRRR